MCTAIKGAYRPRHPEQSKFYQLIKDHVEEFIRVYPERFESQYGYYRHIIGEVIYKYLDCGNPSCGFARVRCIDCGHEYLLSFSCKCRNFCPSCHQKRLVQLSAYLEEEVLEEVPHRQIVFCIPKMLRVYFRNDRSLLGKLSQCAFRTLLMLYQAALEDKGVVPGVVISIQTFGNLMNFHPHLHALVSEGCFDSDGIFYTLPVIPTDKIEEVFSAQVFKMLLAEKKISEEMVKKICSWRHSGFSVHQEVKIAGHDRAGLKGLAEYIGRAPLSEEKMIVKEDGKGIVYHSKMNPGIKRNFEVFSPLEWLAAITAQIPDKGEHMIRYYGYYSNKSRGMRKKRGEGENTPLHIESPNVSSKECRLRWANLIKKIYEVDPLICPACGGQMKIISFIQEREVIDKILSHLGLLDKYTHSPPPPQKASSPEIRYEPFYDDLPVYDDLAA